MAMTGGRGGGSGEPLSEINVTPMVDVMLVLLIIFMVAAPLLTTGVPVDLPSAQAPQMAVDEETLMLSITRDQKVYLGDQEVAMDRLEQTLRTNERVRRQNEVYVQADEHVPYGFVVRVLAIVRQVGIEKMGLVTDPLQTR